MPRRFASAAVAVAVGSVLSVVAAAAPASAAPDVDCTATQTRYVDVYAGQVFVGTNRLEFMGIAPRIGGTYRVWHVGFKPSGSPNYSYINAYEAPCNPAGDLLGTADLTRTPAQTLFSYEPPCAAGSSFVTDTTSYTLIGNRPDAGDVFRYWSSRYDSGGTLFYGVYPARCP